MIIFEKKRCRTCINWFLLNQDTMNGDCYEGYEQPKFMIYNQATNIIHRPGKNQEIYRQMIFLLI